MTTPALGYNATEQEQRETIKKELIRELQEADAAFVSPTAVRSLPGYHTYQLDDYRHFNRVVDRNFAGNRQYVWRGHAQAEWRLESTLARELMQGLPKDAAEAINWPRKVTQQTQNHLVTYLKQLSRVEPLELEYRNLFDKVVGEQSKNHSSFLATIEQLSPQEKGLLFEVLANAQHHKLFTPLLDWSESPFVALHFAFAKEEPKDGVGERVVYALNRELVKRLSRQGDGLREDSIYFVESLAFGNPRIVGQAGLFTYCPSHNSIEDWVVAMCEKAPLSEHPALLRFRIGNKLRTECLDWLNAMNVNYPTIYPDWEGAALAANVELLKQMHQNRHKAKT